MWQSWFEITKGTRFEKVEKNVRWKIKIKFGMKITQKK